MAQEESRPIAIFILLAAITAVVSVFSAVLMTEPGQSLNLPREWVIGYYANRWLFMAINLLLLAALWWLNKKYKFWQTIWMVLASIGVLACIVAANFIIGSVFPGIPIRRQLCERD